MAHPLSLAFHRARLQQTKPTQDELDTARRVCLWLSDHAYYWPDEWATEDDKGGRRAHALMTTAANNCGTSPDLLITSVEDEAARDAHTRHARDEASLGGTDG